MNSSLQTLNECEIILKKDWEVMNTFRYSNITCNAGRESIAKKLVDFSPEISKLGVIQYIAIWTDNTATTVNDTQLGAEIYRQLIDEVNSSNVGTVVTVYTTFPTWPVYTAEEAGVFLDATATSSPNTWSLLCHTVFGAPVVKPSDQSLTVKWTISLTNA